LKKILHPSLTLGVKKPYIQGGEAAVERLRMVLETRPGAVPWSETFGCDLVGFIGQTADGATVSRAKWQVETAIRTWLPDLQLGATRVKVVNNQERSRSYREPQIPTAESALVSLGTQARFDVELDIHTEEGMMSIEAVVEP